MRFLLHNFGQFHPGHQIGPNTWPHFDLLWFHTGRVTVKVGRARAVELAGGDGVLIYPSTPFQGRALTHTAYASVQHFAIEEGENLPQAIGRLENRRSGHRVYRGFARSPVVRDIERAIALSAEPPSAALRALRELNLAMILQQLGSRPTRSEGVLPGRELLETWRREFRAKPVSPPTVAELARRMELPAERLRAFLARHASNPRRFLLAMRMEHARRLLTGGDLPIKAIAAETGYADVVAFHHAFTSYFSETPMRHRERQKRSFKG